MIWELTFSKVEELKDKAESEVESNKTEFPLEVKSEKDVFVNVIVLSESRINLSVKLTLWILELEY